MSVLKVKCSICYFYQIDDYSLVKFVPLNITDEESVETLLMQVDQAMQWGEEKEPREPKVIVRTNEE